MLTAALSSCVLLSRGVTDRVGETFKLENKACHKKYHGGAGYVTNKFIYLSSSKYNYDFIFAGDSYALQYALSVGNSELKLLGLFDHAYLILPIYSRYSGGKENFGCSKRYRQLKSELSKNNRPLILAHSWDSYRNKLIVKGGKKPLKLNRSEYVELLFADLRLLISDDGNLRGNYLLGVPHSSKLNAFECLAGADLQGTRFFGGCSVY